MHIPSPRGVVFTAALFAVLVSCQGKLFSITIDDQTSTVVPKGTPLETLLGDFGFGEFAQMDLTEASELQNQGVEPGDIKDVRLVVFDLEVTSPAGGDLSFIESMEVLVEAPGLESKTLASRTDFPVGQSRVEFDIADLDLTEYVVSESMTLTTNVTGGRPDDDTTVVAYYEIDVGVTSQGACNQAKKGKQE